MNLAFWGMTACLLGMVLMVSGESFTIGDRLTFIGWGAVVAYVLGFILFLIHFLNGAPV